MPSSCLCLLAGLLLAAATTRAQTTPSTPRSSLPTLSQRYALATPTPGLKIKEQPLYVVDGMALETPLSLDALAPEDIANITILKKAAGTAQYGASVAGGVVLVTTKKGSKDSGNK